MGMVEQVQEEEGDEERAYKDNLLASHRQSEKLLQRAHPKGTGRTTREHTLTRSHRRLVP